MVVQQRSFIRNGAICIVAIKVQAYLLTFFLSYRDLSKRYLTTARKQKRGRSKATSVLETVPNYSTDQLAAMLTNLHGCCPFAYS